ncbi:MAG: FprA family A-type flavoprotein [Methanomicrobiales archaeon]|nr:FprA family A-type flavoprotein [Methanomicrobiales archaeon]
MAVRKMAEGVEWVGSIDWSRRLFDELIPLPSGTSYNAYLVRGKGKTALVDTVDPTKVDELMVNLARAGVKRLDYVVVNHAEQDHAGSIPMILGRYPEAKLVTNEKCAEMLSLLLHVDKERVMQVKDLEALELGGLTLKFHLMPWVHWPETMVTYLEEEKMLFTCDFFGSHLATAALYADEEPGVLEAAKRYYAEIMMPFRSSIKGHLEQLKKLEIETIAPSHGPIWRDPSVIMDAYREWVSESLEDVVVIPYVSMHGSTEKMVEHFSNALIERGIRVKPFNLAVTDTGELAKALIGAATFVLGTPTVLFGPHPKAVYAAYLISVLKPKARYASLIGSYGWGGKTAKMVSDLVSAPEREIIPPVLVRGYPNREALKALDALADQIAERHRSDPRIRR